MAARPQSIMMFWPAACTKEHGPARLASGIGLPVPRRVTFITISMAQTVSCADSLLDANLLQSLKQGIP